MILMALPESGFDPTEVTVPWKFLLSKGVEIVFSTPFGEESKPDYRLLTGRSLGIFKNILTADKSISNFIIDLERDSSFLNPLSYSEIQPYKYDAIILPGGHDKRIISYLESKQLQNIVNSFFNMNRPVGAICHGTLVVARTMNPETKRSVIYNYKTTSLLNIQEVGAYYLTKIWAKDYYRTYPTTVQDEVTSYLQKKDNFIRGKFPLMKDSKNKYTGFVVQDKNYLSARWPGDAYTFSKKFYELVYGQFSKV